MDDIAEPPASDHSTSDDPIVRLTDTLRGMHDRVSAQDDISKLTEAFLLLIRAILSYLARSVEPASTPEPAPAPSATTKPIRTPHHATGAKTTRFKAPRVPARQPIRHGLRARRANPQIHPATATGTTTMPAPHRPNLLKIVPPH